MQLSSCAVSRSPSSYILLVGLALLALLGTEARLDAADSPRPAMEQSKFPCPENEIARYTAHRVNEPIRIDGKLDEAVWQRAPHSPRFVDIIDRKSVV